MILFLGTCVPKEDSLSIWFWGDFKVILSEIQKHLTTLFCTKSSDKLYFKPGIIYFSAVLFLFFLVYLFLFLKINNSSQMK